MADAGAPMTPERWRAVDAVLQAALSGDRECRDQFVRETCGDDEALRREVESLLAVHDGMAADFLEQAPAEPGVAAQQQIPRFVQDDSARIAALADALAGRYAIEREIARGGMATVYVARDVRHGRRVAIKVMRDEVAAAVGTERFLEEIRVTASLQHPNILPLFDSGELGTVLWYVMPFVDGETLRSRLARDGRLPVGEAMRLARQVADALEYAHARGIVHRDIKPENVLLQGSHALVADFGIALALEHAGSDRLTQTGLTLGTPQYMAPEQAAGERTLDARADIYALGVLTYEMVTGQSPFAAASRQAVVQRMLSEMPVPLASHRAEVSASLSAAVQRALAKQPEDRFSSAAAFAAALITSSEPAVVAPMPSSGEGNPPAPKRTIPAHIAVYLATGAIALGLAAGLGLGRSSLLGEWRKKVSPASPVPIATAKLSPEVSADASVAGSWPADGLSLMVVDRAGKLVRRIPSNRPWTPRFAPDGYRVAFGAYPDGRESSDIWIADLKANTVQRLTDSDGDSNDPQWSPDGKALAFSVNAPDGKDVAVRWFSGDTTTRIVAALPGTQFPSDWLRDGSALIVTENGDPSDILVQPVGGARARRYKAAGANPTLGRVSPNGQWIAYTAQGSGGRSEVYLAPFPSGGRPILLSQAGGSAPVWRGDGRELYYWRDDALVAVQIDALWASNTAAGSSEKVLFRAPYYAALNTMYDASPDGQTFVIVEGR